MAVPPISERGLPRRAFLKLSIGSAIAAPFLLTACDEDSAPIPPVPTRPIVSTGGKDATVTPIAVFTATPRASASSSSESKPSIVPTPATKPSASAGINNEPIPKDLDAFFNSLNGIKIHYPSAVLKNNGLDLVSFDFKGNQKLTELWVSFPFSPLGPDPRFKSINDIQNQLQNEPPLHPGTPDNRVVEVKNLRNAQAVSRTLDDASLSADNRSTIPYKLIQLQFLDDKKYMRAFEIRYRTDLEAKYKPLVDKLIQNAEVLPLQGQ